MPSFLYSSSSQQQKRRTKAKALTLLHNVRREMRIFLFQFFKVQHIAAAAARLFSQPKTEAEWSAK
jgi:hypothetical protein